LGAKGKSQVMELKDYDSLSVLGTLIGTISEKDCINLTKKYQFHFKSIFNSIIFFETFNGFMTEKSLQL
jgi:hypothetical protein